MFNVKIETTYFLMSIQEMQSSCCGLFFQIVFGLFSFSAFLVYDPSYCTGFVCRDQSKFVWNRISSCTRNIIDNVLVVCRIIIERYLYRDMLLYSVKLTDLK